jgi:hypothetical protein
VDFYLVAVLSPCQHVCMHVDDFVCNQHTKPLSLATFPILPLQSVASCSPRSSVQVLATPFRSPCPPVSPLAISTASLFGLLSWPLTASSSPSSSSNFAALPWLLFLHLVGLPGSAFFRGFLGVCGVLQPFVVAQVPAVAFAFSVNNAPPVTYLPLRA